MRIPPLVLYRYIYYRRSVKRLQAEACLDSGQFALKKEKPPKEVMVSPPCQSSLSERTDREMTIERIGQDALRDSAEIHQFSENNLLRFQPLGIFNDSVDLLFMM